MSLPASPPSRDRATLDPTPLLSATGVAKNYGAVKALRNAALELRSGEVHAPRKSAAKAGATNNERPLGEFQLKLRGWYTSA